MDGAITHKDKVDCGNNGYCVRARSCCRQTDAGWWGQDTSGGVRKGDTLAGRRSMSLYMLCFARLALPARGSPQKRSQINTFHTAVPVTVTCPTTVGSLNKLAVSTQHPAQSQRATPNSGPGQENSPLTAEVLVPSEVNRNVVTYF